MFARPALSVACTIFPYRDSLPLYKFLNIQSRLAFWRFSVNWKCGRILLDPASYVPAFTQTLDTLDGVS